MSLGVPSRGRVVNNTLITFRLQAIDSARYHYYDFLDSLSSLLSMQLLVIRSSVTIVIRVGSSE